MDPQGISQGNRKVGARWSGRKYAPQLLLFFLVLAAGGAWFIWSESGDWVLRVNGTKISAAEWQAETDRELEFFSQVYGLDLRQEAASRLREQVRQQVLNQMISRILLKKAALKAGIRVEEAEVDARLAVDADRVGGHAGMEQILKEQGMTLEQYREQVRDMLLVQKLQEQVTRGVKVEEAEIRSAYESSYPPEVKYGEVRESLRQSLLAAKKNQIFMKYLEKLWERGRFMYRVNMPKKGLIS